MTRDPRVNPAAGDKIEADGCLYRVVKTKQVNPRFTAVDYVCCTWHLYPMTQSISLTSWRRMAKGSKVLHQAEARP